MNMKLKIDELQTYKLKRNISRRIINHKLVVGLNG